MLTERIGKRLKKESKKAKTLQFSMHLPSFGINYSYSSTMQNQHFHSASVGKLMTSTLVFIAIERGNLSIDAHVKQILKPGMLDGLFVVDGHDFQEEITVKQLLGHLSGVNDYCFYSEGFDQNDLAPLFINGVDVHRFTSLSCDFSGGGLSTTANDLLKFLDCLQNLRLIGRHSLSQMADFSHRYREGLYYGVGMMQVRFEDFFFLLKSLPRLQGHLGVTGVHAWYDPITKDAFVLNVGNTKDMVLSFKLLIAIVQMVQREHIQKRN